MALVQLLLDKKVDVVVVGVVAIGVVVVVALSFCVALCMFYSHEFCRQLRQMGARSVTRICCLWHKKGDLKSA